MLKTSETISGSKSRLIKAEVRDGRNYEKLKAAAKLLLTDTPSLMIIEHLKNKVTVAPTRSPSFSNVQAGTSDEIEKPIEKSPSHPKVM